MKPLRVVQDMWKQAFIGEEKWAKTYRIPFEYKNGSGKYYEIGMIKCMLLDQLNPKWKNEFGLDKGFDVLLSEVE